TEWTLGVRDRSMSSAPSPFLAELVRELIDTVGERHVLIDPAAQQRFLKDFSWYSPVLAEAFIDTRIDAVRQPATLAELERTVACFLAGGSGGLGSVSYGRTWDNNFASVDMLTAQEPPRTIRLDGDDLRMVMHTYGTVGIVTRVRLPLIAAHSWQGWYATFPDFDVCFEFGWNVGDDPSAQKRLVSVHEAPIPSVFEPFKQLFSTEMSAALLVLD